MTNDGPRRADAERWTIRARGFDAAAVARDGSNFLIGNGYLGVRGTLEPWRAERFPAVTVSDTYDMADGRWRELCTAPNGLYAEARLEDGTELLGDTDPERSWRELDLRTGTFRHGTTASGADGPRIVAERFASYADLHLVAWRLRIEARRACSVTLALGIDGRVWSLNGDHFARSEPVREEAGPHATRPNVAGPRLGWSSTTVERGVRLEVREGVRVEGGRVHGADVALDDGRLLRRFVVDVPANGTATIVRAFAVASSNDVDPATDVAGDPAGAAAASVERALASGWNDLVADHARDWERFWELSDVAIDGDDDAQRALRFAIYQNRIATPEHSDRLPIGARGLSCQAYQGAAFWDQEAYNLDVFLNTRPEVARRILSYRWRTLPGARRKAERLGYRGAFYAWISGDDGEELCPDWFFREVVTGRPIRNHFNDWQMHVSPDVAVAVRDYVDTTGDEAFLIARGAEIAFEVARFLASFVVWIPHRRRWEIRRVLGPDEYHENVDDNAFTNEQSRSALVFALEAHARLREVAPDALSELRGRIDLSDEELGAWRDVVDRLHLPGPDTQTGLIEQFRGYFDLEDVTPAELERRLIDPAEYWGWPIGVAVHTQVIKQADVVQLLARRPDLPERVTAANYDYYEPRTQHGSSLSPSVHAVVAARLGRMDDAARYFRKSALVDLGGDYKAVSGGTFIGGIHTAACAGTWQAAVRGFGGLRTDEERLGLDPQLPAGWDRLAFSVVRHGGRLHVEVRPDAVAVRADAANDAAVPVRVREARFELAPGERRVVEARR